jgi:leucine dehydrogenase
MNSPDAQQLQDGLDHTMVRFVHHKDGSPLGFIAIHRGTKAHPAFGATRVFEYPTVTAASNDALRLGRLMSYKNAFASTRYGGGKGVIMMTKEDQADPDRRAHLLARYAEEVNKLGGAFVTGADVGVNMDDVRLLRAHSKFIVGLSRDPVLHTVRGVLAALRAALVVRFGDSDMSKYSYSVLGAGKVGWGIIAHLSEAGARSIVASDIDPLVLERLSREYPDVLLVSPEELLHTPVDVFIPCAMGGILNTDTITHLQTKVIVGAANNQLADLSIGDQLHVSHVLYVPDYVANGGGVMSVINEYEQHSDEALDEKVSAIEHTVLDILETSARENIPPHRIADRIAEERIESLFPRLS